jgi:hypothetical protein
MSDTIRVKGNAQTLPGILSNLIAIHNLIESRDIGDFVGLPLEDAMRPQPISIKLTIFFYSEKEPPFRPQLGKRFVRGHCIIPDAKRSLLKWGEIKAACGGENGYMWGRFCATARLASRRQIQVYGATKQEAEERLKSLAAFSASEIVALSVSEKLKEGDTASGKLLYKESTRVYPAYFTVVNSQKILLESKRERQERENAKDGTVTPTLSGNFLRTKTQKIPLWIKTEPTTAKAIIKEALRVRSK